MQKIIVLFMDDSCSKEIYLLNMFYSFDAIIYQEK